MCIRLFVRKEWETLTLPFLQPFLGMCILMHLILYSSFHIYFTHFKTYSEEKGIWNSFLESILEKNLFFLYTYGHFVVCAERKNISTTSFCRVDSKASRCKWHVSKVRKNMTGNTSLYFCCTCVWFKKWK